MEVYFDHISTTPLHPEVLEAMLPYLKKNFGNPSSLHRFGSEAKKAINKAREDVALLIGSDNDEIIFTSSGTEANNLALKGVALAYQGKGRHIVVSSIEHFSVLHAARTLEKWGFKVTYLPVDFYGLVDPDDVSKAVSDETILVSIQLANPEVGTIQPIEEISEITRSKNVLFHTDAVAAVGNIEVDVEKLGVDLLSLSAHQFYGPKGVGALYVRKGVRIVPLFDGGIQERGRRAGTENVAAIVGLGKAAEITRQNMKRWTNHILGLRKRLFAGLRDKIEELYLNGHPDLRLPGNLNITVKYVEGESMLILLDMEGIMASSGSSCASYALKSSHVLKAMGIDPVNAHSSLLFSLGQGNTEEEVDYCVEKMVSIVKRLRGMSPLYKERATS
jgi:cysteine desulfurase